MAISRDKLVLLVEPVVEAMGLTLWGVEFFVRGKTSMLRVYIDHEDGVGVGDCERVSRQLSSVFDVEDPIHGEYTLEVSSPGLDRPLFTPAQYRGFIGETINVKLRFPFEGRRSFKGKLEAIEAGDIVLNVDQHEYSFPFESVEKARVIPHF
ncbi:MAG: ribosome maturation factor RimP [Gammaproteobacteria bacterium]|nr:MAG: ribosome maturation factor RimP [Gammaproteobacteria bacterium]RLA54103.1 MAG: ribosome maturation factor RimP [Gammaproteobacteria bacterium]